MRRSLLPGGRTVDDEAEGDTREMSAYQTLVVGTDGSDTSLRAVDHAAAFAADHNAKLIIAMAHLPNADKGGWGRPARPDRVIDGRAEVVLRDEGDYIVHGMAPIYAILREARDRARAVGAKNIEMRPILVGHLGGPAHALSRLAKEVNADLLVVGNEGVATPIDKWLGSVPGNVLRRAKTDVLVVHTTDADRPHRRRRHR
jgi:nucleotide-binding universal stress UspA family protein